MKLKNISLYLVLLSGVAGFVSCKKEKLSPIPQTTLSDAVAFSSPDRIKQQVFGVYSAAKSGNFLGGRALVYNDVRGEDWLNITGNGVTALGVWNFSIVSSDNQVENMWSAGYAAINRANVVLEGLDANPSVIPSTVANQYRGEVRFVRAVSYYYLVNLYGRKPYTADNGASPGLPLRLTASKSSEGADLARSTVAEVYNQILADLNFAETNLPLTYGAAGDSNVVRAHRNSAIAFKTRVYLSMGKYAEVITEGNKLVPATAPFIAPSGVAHRLAPSILTVFRSPYTDVESIFSLPMSQASAPGTQNGLALYENAEFALNPSGILGNAQFTATDARRTNFVTSTTPIRYTKFNDDNNNYVPIIRYAEVMLNLAEALARTNTGVDARAVALLNAVHQRSDPATTLAPASQAALIDMILTERRIELLGEGVRSLDIMRLNATFPAKGSVSSVPPSSVTYVWPIPASELLYNKLMTANQ
ncbi:MAG TPA: RagB/SusD family nutrient uptake outer membrane protein [Flavisolibacter sp.]|nr:RagB/SusD family nutrient uptake outer membrane protein [Flavisolibacter sp.]